MGAGGATSATDEVYDQCQIMDSHPGLDLEIGAGIILADHSQVLQVVATQASDSISYCLDEMPSRHGSDPSREGWPVVGDDLVINIFENKHNFSDMAGHHKGRHLMFLALMSKPLALLTW
ncbi:hypothetical protein TIFTF001_042629, partial [Ficus carica]